VLRNALPDAVAHFAHSTLPLNIDEHISADCSMEVLR